MHDAGADGDAAAGFDGSTDVQDAGAGGDGGPAAACRWLGDGPVVVGRLSTVGGALAGPLHAVAVGDGAVLAFSDDAGEDAQPRVRFVEVRLGESVSVAREDAPDAVPPGSSGPHLVKLGGTWWLFFERPTGGVARAPLSAPFGGTVGAVSTVLDVGARPAVLALAAGGLLAWWQAGGIWAARLDGGGNLVGERLRLGDAAEPVSPSVASMSSGEVLVAWPGGVRRLDVSVGGALASAEPSVSWTAPTRVAVAGSAPRVPEGYLPLQAALAYDVRPEEGAPRVRFTLLDAMGEPAYGTFSLEPGGAHAWGMAMTPFRTGYALAYRWRSHAGERGMLRLALLDREACELGRGGVRFPVTEVLSREARVSFLVAISEGTLLLGWLEPLDGTTEYRVGVISCE